MRCVGDEKRKIKIKNILPVFQLKDHFFIVKKTVFILQMVIVAETGWSKEARMNWTIMYSIYGPMIYTNIFYSTVTVRICLQKLVNEVLKY